MHPNPLALATAPDRGGSATALAPRPVVPVAAIARAGAPSTAPASPPARAGPPRALPPRKARHRDECTTLEQLPNIGRAMAADLRLLGLRRPQDLTGRDPLALFHELARRSGQRQDPCVLDTLMAAVDFMGGAEPLPWWHYTGRRKREHPVL